MVFFILAYVVYFGWMGNHLFEGTLEGTSNFASFGDSVWSMWILITTANFPDVMLSAYASTPMSFFMFYIYLYLGLFLFMNLLLAIFYTSFQDDVDDDI